MEKASDAFQQKAAESLATAQSELANERYNSCANRCYYACFQAAVAALLRAGIRPRGEDGRWGHDYVQAQFVGQLINRRKRYPSDLRATLSQAYELRQVADYKVDFVTQVQASRILSRSRSFVQAIRDGGDTNR